MKLFASSLMILLFPLVTSAQSNDDTLALAHARAVMNQFKELLALPNDAHFPEDIEQNIQWCEKAFPQRGFTTARLQTPTVPLLLAERRSKHADAPVILA